MLPKDEIFEKGTDLAVNSLGRAILARIEETAGKIEHGSITLIVQDKRLIQMDVIQKVRFLAVTEKSTKGSQGRATNNVAKTSLGEKITAALKGMNFGQVTLVIKEGRIVQVERTEKQRFPGLEGIYGEGI